MTLPKHDPRVLAERLARPQFPKASACDPALALGAVMGPNVLWLAEWAAGALDLRPGLDLLDLGCGKAASSIFLAQAFGVTVTAADLWIAPEENAARIAAAGLGRMITPVRAEAHALPFETGRFDLIISLDAYHYFGTDDLYIGYISRYLKPGGRIAIVVPCRLEEAIEVPEHLAPYWDWQFCSFHSPAWWRRHWEKTGRVEVEVADHLPDGWRLWAEWCELCADVGGDADSMGRAASEGRMLRLDAGRTLGFARVVARRALPPASPAP